MTRERFRLVGEVRTANRREVLPVLQELLGAAQIEETESGFKLEAQMEGDSHPSARFAAAAHNRHGIAAVVQPGRAAWLGTGPAEG